MQIIPCADLISGFVKELFNDKSTEGVQRYENVQELLNAIKEFVDNPENEDKTLSSFLQSVSLLTSADDEKDTDTDKITLMTIHAAKGLEFKHVYIVGMCSCNMRTYMCIMCRDGITIKCNASKHCSIHM